MYSIKTLIGMRCISCLFTDGYLVKLLTSSSAMLADLQASRYGLRSNSKKKMSYVFSLTLFLDLDLKTNAVKEKCEGEFTRT